jgi:hypothetical protein
MRFNSGFKGLMTLLLGDAICCRMVGWVKRLCKGAVWSTWFWSCILLLVWRYSVQDLCQDSRCPSRDSYRFYRSNINCLLLKWHQTKWSRFFSLRVYFLKLNIKICCTVILPVFYGIEAEESTWDEGIREQVAEKWICSLGGESGWRVQKIGKWGILWFALLTICRYSDQTKEDEMAWHVLRVGKKRNVYKVLVGKH